MRAPPGWGRTSTRLRLPSVSRPPPGAAAPCFFRVLGPWDDPEREQAGALPGFVVILIGGAFSVLGLALLLAWRNFRAGRGDNRGAFRFGMAIFLIFLVKWFFDGNHALSLEWFLQGFLGAVSSSLFWAVLAAALYMGLEPHVRRRWPQSMVTWTRLLGGGLRDPLVGGHILIGIAIGTLLRLVPVAIGVVVNLSSPVLDSVSGIHHMVASALDLARDQILIAMGGFFLFFLLRVIVRKEWIAIGSVMAIIVILSGMNGAWIAGAIGSVIAGLSLLFIARFGLLPMSVSIFTSSLLSNFPLTTDTSLWYFGSTVFVVSIVLAMAAWATYTALAGRKMFIADLLDAD